MRTIEIIVSPKGETTVQTKGFAGSSCREASKFIEQALGQRTGDRWPTTRRQDAQIPGGWLRTSRCQGSDPCRSG
jgi:hypothetical protein